ncbi:MAG: MBL fold metallo-hydrolase [Myxococcales bacterium]|nr:MBL fold metallo-hydrolase [Myxococcales bacterium]
MKTKIDEISDDIFRLSTCVPEAAPGGFTFNQFLIKAEEPLLFHTGPRRLFPLVSEAIERVVPLTTLRWITFGHVESDESGAMNELLAAAPHAEVAHGQIGCMVSLDDLCDRPPRKLADGEVLDLGGKRVRHIDTPHVPHGWESRVLFEETGKTLFCGDLFAQVGDGPALATGDIVGPALATEEMFRATALTRETAPTIRRLAALEPHTLAVMHGSSSARDCSKSLLALADAFGSQLTSAASGVMQ